MTGTITRSEENKSCKHSAASLLSNTSKNDSLSHQKRVFHNSYINYENTVSHKNEHITPKVEKLDLSFCGLLKLPIEICQLKFLKILNLSNNAISILPNEIQNFKNLTSLNLSGNKLNGLPKFLKHINQLVYLNLSHNEFDEVPDILFFGLRNIKILDLSFNKISKFKEHPDCFSNLIHLKLSNNLLESLPKWVFDGLCQIQILDLSENQINLDWPPLVTYFNSGIFESLKILSMSYCNISCDKVQFFSHFKRLEILYLGSKNNSRAYKKNYLGDINITTLKGCCNLKQLFLDNTQVSFLPGAFEGGPKIELLSLSENWLSWLPDAFCNMSYLVVLDLSSNQLLFLPDDIDRLNNLKFINLANNSLYQLPENFYKLKCLEFVDLYNNKIEVLHYNVFTMKNLKGIDLGMNYLNFDELDCGSNLNEIKKYYNCLKEKFREKFNHLSRSDFQLFEHNEVYSEENYSYSYSSCNSWNSIGCSDENDSLDAEVNNECKEQTYVEENWEHENSCRVDEDEEFDPNVSGENWCKNTPRLAETVWEMEFRNNFCPANGHVRSILTTFKRNVRSAFKSETLVEGQFDSD